MQLGLVLTLVSILMVLVLIGTVGQIIRIIQFKQRGGKVVAVIGATPKNGFFWGVALLAVIYIVKTASGGTATEAGMSLSVYLYYLCLGAMAVLGIVGGLDRCKVRENGLANASLMVTWDEINNYHWDGQSLILDHRNLIFKSWKTRLRLGANSYQILKPYLEKIASSKRA